MNSAESRRAIEGEWSSKFALESRNQSHTCKLKFTSYVIFLYRNLVVLVVRTI